MRLVDVDLYCAALVNQCKSQVQNTPMLALQLFCPSLRVNPSMVASRSPEVLLLISPSPGETARNKLECLLGLLIFF